MNGFFSEQVIDVVKHAKIRSKKEKSNKNFPKKSTPSNNEQTLTTLEERVQLKKTEDICTGCVFCKMKRNPKKPPPPGYRCTEDFIWANQSEEGVGNKQSGFVILIETLDRKSELLRKFLEKKHNLTLEDYYMIPSLRCLPIEGNSKKQNEAIAPYVACSILNVKNLLLEIKPKFILTIGKAFYSITKQEEPKRNKIQYARVYSREYQTNVFPAPNISFMLDSMKNPEGIKTYFFQDNWYRYVLDQHIETIKNKKIPRFSEENIHDHIIKDTHEIKTTLKNLLSLNERYFSYDIETSGFVWMEDIIHGVSLSFDEIDSYYLLWSSFDRECKFLLNKLFIEKKTIAHNGKFDEKFLIYNGLPDIHTDEDTMLAHHILRAEKSHGLKTLAYLYTQFGGYDYTLDQYMKDYKIKKYSDLPLEIIGPYACMDTRVTFIIWKLFTKEFSKEENKKLKWIYENISVPLAKVFRKAEMRGIKIDEDYLDNFSESKKKESLELEEECYLLLGEEINLKSNKALPLAIQKLNMPVVKKTPTGGMSTDKEAMEIWAKQGWPFAKTFQKWSEINTLITNFIGDVELKNTEEKNGLYQHIRSDGRVHNSFLVHGAETGRTASATPNLQNQPKDKAYRKIYKCPPGYTFIEADFSQAELRVAAVLSDDQAMKNAFRLGQDIHCTTICSMTGKSYEEIKKLNDEKNPEVLKLRKKAKTVNFGVVYGESAFSLAEDLGISVEEAEKFLDDYFKGFSGLGKWRKDTQQFTATNGCTYTYWGRIRRFPELSYRQGLSKVKFSAYMRQAMNTPVQGSASDYALYSMIGVDEFLEKGNYKTGIIAMVHDSIVMEAALDEIDEIVPRIKEIMENRADIGVKMVADVEVSDIWGF